jgi:membrane-bound lytic murein transglycosylase B
MRVFLFLLFALICAGYTGMSHAADGFAGFLQGVRTEAAQKGISQKTIDAALTNVGHNPRVIELDRKQPESRLTWAQYKKNVISQARINEGRALLRMHKTELKKASDKYGVPPQVIVALWGMETSYGDNTGGFGVIEALATLAYDGRRSKFFRGELFNALQIIDDGHISASNMTGSWAGAMGQNQFMPSSFKAFAVDGNSDGKRDIWKTKADVFASTANYLGKSGWDYSQKWGREVKLSQPLSKNLTGLDREKSIVEWSRMGVTLPGGGKLPTTDGMYASLVMPDGEGGPAYLVYNNYRVIMKWNKSIYFATSVGLLSDLIAKAE